MQIIKFLFLYLFFIKITFGAIYQANKNNDHLTIDCNANNFCNSLASNQAKQVIKISGRGLAINQTNFIWQNNDVVEIRTGVGSGEAYSRFFDFKKMQLSKLFYNVSFIGPEADTVIIQSDAASNNVYLMGCIFNPTVQPVIILTNSVIDLGSFKLISGDKVRFGYYDVNNNYQYKIISFNLGCGDVIGD